MTCVGDVHRIFSEDHRIVVSECHALAAVRLRGLRNRFRRRAIHQRVHLTRLGDVPVLAELARQIAPRRPEREHARARIKLVERLFLDGVDAETR